MFTFGGSGNVGGSDAEDRSGSHSGCRVEGTPCEAGGLTEKDDVEAYLVTFERIYMQAYTRLTRRIGPTTWHLNCPVEHLLPCLLRT